MDERLLDAHRQALAGLRVRIGLLKDQLERAYERERELVNIIADAEGVPRRYEPRGKEDPR